MKQRASTDGCLNYEGVATDEFSHLYVGDIEIAFESVFARKNYIKNENQDLVAVEEETRSLPHHHLSFMKLVQARRKNMRRFICKSLIFLKGP